MEKMYCNLTLYSCSGKVKYSRWYKNIRSARAVRSVLDRSALFKDGDTWVIWRFASSSDDTQLLLWSSRPLAFSFVRDTV